MHRVFCSYCLLFDLPPVRPRATRHITSHHNTAHVRSRKNNRPSRQKSSPTITLSLPMKETPPPTPTPIEDDQVHASENAEGLEVKTNSIQQDKRATRHITSHHNTAHARSRKISRILRSSLPRTGAQKTITMKVTKNRSK